MNRPDREQLSPTQQAERDADFFLRRANETFREREAIQWLAAEVRALRVLLAHSKT